MTTRTASLTDFLTARLDEDEAAAVRTPRVEFRVASESEHASNAITAHALRHDPARVLAEVAAKRAIVDKVACDHCEPDEALQWALRVLSHPYRDHPDYNESWRP